MLRCASFGEATQVRWVIGPIIGHEPFIMKDVADKRVGVGRDGASYC